MPRYSEEEQDQIIRAYLGPAGKEGPPACPLCGEGLSFQNQSAAPGFSVQVRCADCGAHFIWEQQNLPQPWKSLHVDYFLERYRSGEMLRCPVDDSYVLYVEYSDNILEFRCPYCNRRGRALKPAAEPTAF